MTATKKSSKSGMSDHHKAAMAKGRDQGRVVRAYLEALEAAKPKRGRKRTPESMKQRLQRINDELPSAEPLKRLGLVQERIDLERQLESGAAPVDLTALEDAFIKAAAGYSERKGISYAAWRELGVPANTLSAAGIQRTRT
jgi:hypothetical protein